MAQSSTVLPQSAAPAFRLAKVLGVLAIAASAVANEYGAGINYVAVQSLSVYPMMRGLVPLAMFATGIFLLPKVFLYVRYARFLPRAGSAYVWIGRSLSPPVSFVVNFVWWVGITTAMGVVAFAFGTFLGQALVGLGAPWGAAILTPGGHVVVGLAAIWIIYGVHATGVHRYGLLATVLLAVIVVTAVTISIIGFVTSPETFVRLATAKAGTTLVAPATLGPPTLSTFISVCTLFIFAYGGLSAAPSLGGEARDAGRTMPRGIIWGWAIALVLFTLVAAALFHVAPWWAIVGLITAGKSSYVTAPGLISLVAPAGISSALNVAVALIVGKTLAPQMMTSSRLLFAWAQDHVLPEVFARTSARHVPLAALTLSAGLGSAFLIQAAFVGWSLGVVVRSFSILLVLFFVAVSALNLKWNPRFAGVEWAREISAGSGVVVAALLSIAIALALIASVLVVPKTPLYFQPLFQGAVAALIALWIYAAAKARARRTGVDLAVVGTEPPLE